MTDRAPLVEELRPAPDPLDACERLAGLAYRLFLDSAAPGPRQGRHSFLCADPVAVLRANGARAEIESRIHGTTAPVADSLGSLRDWLAPHRAPAVEGLPPFQGGAAGYVGYDFARTLERLPAPRHDDLAIPDLVLGLYDWVIAWDHESGRAWLVSTGMPETEPERRRARAAERAQWVKARLAAPSSGTSRPPDSQPRPTPAPSFPVDADAFRSPVALRSSFARDDYVAAVERVRQYVLAGDIFQANLSQRFEAPLSEAPWSLYRRLRARNASPFAAFLDFPEVAVLSASPERFLRVTDAGAVETRPIKGTRPRGATPEEDASLGAELANSAKDRAENLMIVDLMRNDLSRACAPGTVRAPELFALERYATVQHLVSTVVGTLAPGADALDLLRATFPGGSITGAPKLRAMEVIAELEPSARGVYCGSLGYLSVTGALDTSIAIRTAVALGDRVYFSAGGGIIADSDPAEEYGETLDKARGMVDALDGRR